MSRVSRGILGCLFLCLIVANAARAAEGDLTDLSIEELLTVEVTSVAKKRQRVEDSAAAVFVISQEDIRRSGATRITDLFRMVPGVQVGEVDSNSVAVSARGFNERLSNKLLVLVDGRAIYRSALSGLVWDQVLVPLQEIERIEVVRGPGATLWGANAVNGVINIITKHTIDSQGGLLAARVGSTERAGGYARWGGLIGEDGAYRLYARGDVDRGLVDESGDRINDPHKSTQTGFRFDWEPNNRDAFTVQGDIHFGSFEGVVDTLNEPTLALFFPFPETDEEFFGFNALTRWARSGTEFGDFSLQAYADHLERGEFGSTISSTIFGVDFQNTLSKVGRHEIVWGANIQLTQDSGGGTFAVLGNGTESNQLFGVFLQDEIELLSEELFLNLGTKIEYNSFTGTEIQPSARLFWRPDPDLAFWGAVSRAVRTPARFEADLELVSAPIPPFTPLNPGPLPVTVVALGDDELDAETLYAFELGTRFSPLDTLSFDVAAYYNRYDNLIVQEALEPTFGPSGIVVGSIYRNAGEATSLGLEVAADWEVTEDWSLKAAYSFQEIDYRREPGLASTADRFEGLTPSHQLSFRSQYDITSDIEFDLWLRAQDEMKDVSGFVDLDARLAWRPTEFVELAIVGRNLLQTRRVDFDQGSYPAPVGRVARSVYGSVEIKF